MTYEQKQAYHEYLNVEREAHRPVYTNMASWEVAEFQARRNSFDNLLLNCLTVLAILLSISHFWL